MRRFVALALALTFVVAAGCSSGSKTDPNKPADSKKEQVIRTVVGEDPKTLDPALSTGMPEANMESTLFEGLMRLDKDARPIPGMAAAAPEVKDNGSTYVFKLRDAKWSNGDPVTAEDFVYAWKRALDPRTASEYAYQLYYIKGGEKLNTVPLNKVDDKGKEILDANKKPTPRPDAEIKADVEKAMAELGVKAIDAKTLEVKLEAPAPYFLSLTAFHTLYPVNKKAVDAHPTDWFTKPEWIVTNGPFKLKSWTAKDKIIVEKNPQYYEAAKIKLDRVEFNLIASEQTATTMFESGQLDIIEAGVNMTELDRLKKERPNELLILPDLALYFYRFNVTKPPFDNPKVRQALSLAIDRDAIVKNVTKAGQVPAMSMVPAGIPDVNGDFRKNGGDFFKDKDIETAKKLLAEAGFPDGKGFPKAQIMYNTSEGHKKIGEAIQEMWKKNLGIDVELNNVEWQVYLDNETNLNYQIARAGWIGDYVDPMTFVDMFVTGGGNNQTGWSNKAYDDLVKKAKATDDQKVRMQAMHDAEKIIMTELPIMPIYHYVRVRLISPKVKGWIEPLTSPMILRDAYIEG